MMKIVNQMLRSIVGADACCADVEAIVVSYP